MNTAKANDAIDHMVRLMRVDYQACVSGSELAYHAQICERIASEYRAESAQFGRGVKKALREDVMKNIERLEAHAANAASPDVHTSREAYVSKLKIQHKGVVLSRALRSVH